MSNDISEATSKIGTKTKKVVMVKKNRGAGLAKKRKYDDEIHRPGRRKVRKVIAEIIQRKSRPIKNKPTTPLLRSLITTGSQRRIAIFVHFVDVLGAPEESEWSGRNGVLIQIRRHFNYPRGYNVLIPMAAS